MTAPTNRLLIACVGNIFLGDDGFGVEVARRLHGRQYPEGVSVVDFGIRGMELAYTLLDPYDALILVDAAPRGKSPGTVSLLEAATPPADSGAANAWTGQGAPEAHNMDPLKVLRFAQTLGAPPIRTLIVACEPSPPAAEEDEMRMGLSAPVQSAVDTAAVLIDRLVEQLCRVPVE